MRVWSPFPSLPRWWSNHLFGCFWNFYSNDVNLQASTILITPYAWKKAKVVERNDTCVSKSLSFPAGLLILSLSLIGKNCVRDALNRRHFKTINKWLTGVISVCFPESKGLIIGYLCVFSSLSAQASSRPHFRLHARRRIAAQSNFHTLEPRGQFPSISRVMRTFQHSISVREPRAAPLWRQVEMPRSCCRTKGRHHGFKQTDRGQKQTGHTAVSQRNITSDH